MIDDARIEAFWRNARSKGNIDFLQTLIGQGLHDSVPPPVWATSADPAQATGDIEDLLATGTLVQVVALAELSQADQEPPQVGDLAILLDGQDIPRALVRTAGVEVTDSHEDLPDAGGQVVVERFELVYPKAPKRRARQDA